MSQLINFINSCIKEKIIQTYTEVFIKFHDNNEALLRSALKPIVDNIQIEIKSPINVPTNWV